MDDAVLVAGDAKAMGVAQRVEQGSGHVRRLGDRQRLPPVAPLGAATEGAQVHAVHPLHGHVQPAPHRAHVEHRDDVGVPEHHGQASLGHEQAAVAGVLGVLGADHLDRARLDRPLDPDARRGPHLAHAPRAQAMQELVTRSTQAVRPEPGGILDVHPPH